ncbi:MAG: OB-fold nucleic acid binding domain-containing protein, partial [Bosea sp. (in: a-proteobacteria)]
HPMGLLRLAFARDGVSACAGMTNKPDGGWVRVAGIVLVRQRPGKGNAIFITLEDETGIANVVLWARLFERYRKQVMGARLLLVEGRVQKSPEGVLHLMASRVIDRTPMLESLSDLHRAEMPLARADEFLRPQTPRGRHPRDVRIIPKSRDFH